MIFPRLPPKPDLISGAHNYFEENVERAHRISASTRIYLELFGENLMR
jgi:hypothetical protein